MLAWTWCVWESTPFCLGWWAEKLMLPAVVASIIAMLALWQIKKKRAGDYAADQLAKFYAPMLGRLSELAAHRAADALIQEVNAEAHAEITRRDFDTRVTQEYVQRSSKLTEQVRKFFNETLPGRFAEERVSLYVEMRQMFTDNLAYADEETRSNFYDRVYSEVEKMRVYRDAASGDRFLPEAREILGSRVDMSALDSFREHVERKVEALKHEMKS